MRSSLQNECPKYLKIVLPALYGCLKDRDDDVRAVSASAMLPVTDIIVNMEPNQVIHYIHLYDKQSQLLYPISHCINLKYHDISYRSMPGSKITEPFILIEQCGSYVRIFLCSQAGLEIKNSNCQRTAN